MLLKYSTATACGTFAFWEFKVRRQTRQRLASANLFDSSQARNQYEIVVRSKSSAVLPPEHQSMDQPLKSILRALPYKRSIAEAINLRVHIRK